jgi:hypothetical protein
MADDNKDEIQRRADATGRRMAGDCRPVAKAREAEAELNRGLWRDPLHGVPLEREPVELRSFGLRCRGRIW